MIHAPVDLFKTLAKLQEEAGELARALLKGDRPNALEECGDVFIVLAHLIRGLAGSLEAAALAKVEIIEGRLTAGGGV